jgi:hypothetical protein
MVVYEPAGGDGAAATRLMPRREVTMTVSWKRIVIVDRMFSQTKLYEGMICVSRFDLNEKKSVSSESSSFYTPFLGSTPSYISLKLRIS